MSETEREQCYAASAQIAQDIHSSGQYLAAAPLHLAVLFLLFDSVIKLMRMTIVRPRTRSARSRDAELARWFGEGCSCVMTASAVSFP